MRHFPKIRAPLCESIARDLKRFMMTRSQGSRNLDGPINWASLASQTNEPSEINGETQRRRAVPFAHLDERPVKRLSLYRLR